MKITLVNPPITATDVRRLPQLQPPLGLAYVAAALRREGHEVRAVDGVGEGLGRYSPFRPGYFAHGLTIEETVGRIDADSDVIGVGIIFSNFWPLSRELIAAIRRRLPRAVILCGGEHVSACTKLVLDEAPVDYAVVGEGEETAVELLDHLAGKLGAKPLEQICGLAYRSAGGAVAVNPKRRRRRALDEIPWPAWDLFPVEKYMEARSFFCEPTDEKQRPMIILATRGCPYTCKFCSSERMWGTGYFMRSPSDVVDEMEHYIRRYGAGDFHFQDLTPVINGKWMTSLCDEIIARGLNITWKTASGTRSEALDLELLRKMQQSGCDEILLAPESGSPTMNRITRKRVDLEKVLNVVRLVRGHRLPISVTGLMIVGYPEERLRDVWRTYRYLVAMVRAGFTTVYLNRFTAYPGSEYYEIALREGRIRHEDDYFLNLERNFGLLNSRSSWHPRWSGRFVLVLWGVGYLIFFGSYYALAPLNILASVWHVLRNRPRTRFERFFAYRLWQPLQRGKERAPSQVSGERSSPESIAA